ncbi:large conductance mechanosensitive channel protein MscL [Vagococcus intermedius]|uniref:Large-conductance mechanosensitive channel n=1 Tax=Vagococcus intermedius TaxID=2991418 RepID=A0AAF0I674_9ENTE|nr:large conductance mechanosensitive channel protein MscL [Vagococcus intermedius]WEG73423.1 large conductance mechanosensitive channel protein MscL [Vagococcus intermedius]WEG75506.1 large conductance mechanosensitive channel protein MscL [Vagococcus intermedius]
MIKEFKEFIMQGNVLDLAVGVVIGGAFTAIVKSIVDGLITPLVGLVIRLITGSKNGTKEMEGMELVIKGIKFNYGLVISAIITFLITAIVVFLIVKAINKARTVTGFVAEEEVEPEASELLLMEIRDLLAKQNGETLSKEESVMIDNLTQEK